jgi:hypothetical protein
MLIGFIGRRAQSSDPPRELSRNTMFIVGVAES